MGSRHRQENDMFMVVLVNFILIMYQIEVFDSLRIGSYVEVTAVENTFIHGSAMLI